MKQRRTPAPSPEDIVLDDTGSLSDFHHDDIAYRAGWLNEDQYQEATGMPDWYLAGGEFSADELA